MNIIYTQKGYQWYHEANIWVLMGSVKNSGFIRKEGEWFKIIRYRKSGKFHLGVEGLRRSTIKRRTLKAAKQAAVDHANKTYPED